ncbi:hypothetical protein BJ944DRAFT_245203, partial [Cunninghamella echinulata]
VTFSRAKALAIQHNIKDLLYPLFVDDPSIYFFSNPMAPPHSNFFIPTNQLYLQQHTSIEEEIYSPHRYSQSQHTSLEQLPLTPSVPSMSNNNNNNNNNYYPYRDHQQQQQQQFNTDHLLSSDSLFDQQSLIDYSSKGSSSMFSLTVSDSSPATPSQQSLFYDSNMTTATTTSNNNISSSNSYLSSPPPQQQLPMAPTLPSNTNLDSSFYYTHPCLSTASFHEPLYQHQQQKYPFSSTMNTTNHPASFDQATLDYYGSYTQSHTTINNNNNNNNNNHTQSW